MKKTILKTQLIISSAYLIVYIGYSFVTWSIVNPFLWVLNIPLYNAETRGMILMSWILVYGMVIPMVYESSKPIKKP